MRRLTTMLTITMATTALQAAPPTADDWWTAMGRYTGDHMLKDTASGDVVGAFEVEWGVPFERLNYRFHSIGGRARDHRWPGSAAGTRHSARSGSSRSRPVPTDS